MNQSMSGGLGYILFKQLLLGEIAISRAFPSRAFHFNLKGNVRKRQQKMIAGISELLKKGGGSLQLCKEK